MCCISTCFFNLGGVPDKILFLVWHRLQWPQQLLLALKSIANELQHLSWKQLFLWPPWNTSSQHSHTHSPEVYVSKRFELNTVTSCSQGQALSVGHNPQAANCRKGLWKHTRIEGRKKKNVPYSISSSLWASPLVSVCTEKTSVCFHKLSHTVWRYPR